MEDYFKFDLLPTDIKTQVFSFVRFADWIQILARVCSEWRNLCRTTTLPKVLDVRELIPARLPSYVPSVLFDRTLQLAQKYNVTGLVVDVPFRFIYIKAISKALPKILWLQFLPPEKYRGGASSPDKISPLINPITHLEAGMIKNEMKFEDLPPCFPNLQVLNFNTNVTLDALQKMTHKFEKVKVIRTGIRLVQKEEKKKRQTKRRRTAGENVGQLIEFVEAFKKVAPSLTTLYMFWEYKPQSKPADLKREFEAVEEAASSMGIKLYCRDLVRILMPKFVHDPKAEFFLACYKHNNLPYRSYTFNTVTLLEHAIASQNVPAIKALFKNNYTTMEYELSVGNECNRVAPDPPCMTDSAERFPFQVSKLIPYSSSPQCLEIVQILRDNGYDVSKMLAIPKVEIRRTPIWSQLDLAKPSVQTLFEGYNRPIKWFDKNTDGETLLHKVVMARGTAVYIDLLEKQLKKKEIMELMKVTDNRGNTPVHLFGDASVETIDRLIPYAKGCWDLKNKKNRTPLRKYIMRCAQRGISIKEPKLQRFIQEVPKIEDDDFVEFCQSVDEQEEDLFINLLPLWVNKKVNLAAQNEEGLGLFLLKHRLAYLEALKRYGADFKVRDNKGNNFLHALFTEDTQEDDRKELIEFLVKEGVDINQLNENGVTPLLKALQMESPKLEDVEILLKNGADPNVHGPKVLSPLITVGLVRDNWRFPKSKIISIMKLLLDYGAKPVGIKIDSRYLNPLVLAISSLASLKLVRMLIDKGANIMERDDTGNSMLHMVSLIPDQTQMRVKFERIVDYLLQYIDVNDRNILGETVLHLIFANRQGFHYLVSKGADINARTTFGSTPLFVADDANAYGLTDDLASSPKLDPLAINGNGKTLLHVLVKVYEYLLKPFMDKFNAMPIEQQQAIKKVFATNDGYNRTALHEAVDAFELESVKTCVEVFGIAPNMKHVAHILASLTEPRKAENREITKKIITYLLEHGADINAQDEYGDTVLHDAISANCSPEWIKFLLEKGADPKIKNRLGKNAYDLMPNLDKLPPGVFCFVGKVPESQENEDEESSERDSDDEGYTQRDEDDNEIPERFNSDDDDVMEEDEDNYLNNEQEENEDEDMDEDNDHNNNDDSDEDDDNDDDDRPRRRPTRIVFGPNGVQFGF